MQAVKLGSKKALMIVSEDIKNDIRSRLTTHLELKLNEKKFDIFHFNDLEKLRNFSLFTLSTTGNKFWLFLTTYNDRKYCVLLNPKKDQMYLVRYRFDNSLFSDTVMEGEAVKNNVGDKWYFLISDISVYKGIKVKNTSFSQRLDILRIIMEKEYKPDEALNPMILINKTYCDTNYLKHFLEVQIKYIPFKVSGIYFKTDDSYNNDLLYLLDETENKSQTKQNKVNYKSANKEKQKEVKDEIDNKDGKSILWLRKTDFPDVYEVFKQQNKDKVGFASIPDLKTSKYMNETLSKTDGFYYECVWDEGFDKWRPIILYEGGLDKEI